MMKTHRSAYDIREEMLEVDELLGVESDYMTDVERGTLTNRYYDLAAELQESFRAKRFVS